MFKNQVRHFSKSIQLFSLLILGFISTSIAWADASDSCNDVFTDAVGASSNNGTIEIGYQSVIYNNPDTTLNGSSIIYNAYQSPKTCDSDFCSATGSPFTPFTLPTFQTQTGGADYYVAYQSQMSFDGSVTDIKSIGMDSEGQLDMAAPSGGVYKIESLTFGDRGTVNFAAGDYYVETLATTSNMAFNVIGSGTVRIFVKNYAYIQSYADFNSPSGLEGDTGKLIFVFYNGVFFNSGSTFSGYMYVQGKFESQSTNEFWGSIAADEIWTSSTVTLNYRDPLLAPTSPSFTDICTLTGGGGAPSIDHFNISFAPTGSTCPGFASEITIRALDASNAIITDYVGSIDLSVSSAHGTWSINNADGTLTDSTDDDGLASYTFVASDLGEIVLDLENTHADTSIITVEDSAASVSTDSSDISFADNVFLVEPDALQIAGKPLGVKVTLILTDASSNQCGIATDYNQVQIKSWYDPIVLLTGNNAPKLNNVKLKSNEPNSFNETFNFVNGIANITLTNDDVGQFEFYVLDEISQYKNDKFGAPLRIEGQSPTITLRPFALAMDVANDADAANSLAADANGSIFKAVDENFTLTVTPVLWDSADDINNDGIVDVGADLSDNDVIPNFNSTNEAIEITVSNLLPAGGVTGTLSGTTSSSDYSSNSHDYVLSYSEAGIVSLSAQITNNGFLNSGVDALTTLNTVGRFIPDHFSVSLNAVNLVDGFNACGITYQGQELALDTTLDFTFNALNASGLPVLNYAGDFNKFDTASFLPTLNRTATTSTLGTAPNISWLAPSISDETNFDGDWVISIEVDSIEFPKSNSSPLTSDLPFSAELYAQVSSALLTDSDDVCFDTGSGCSNFESNDITGATIIYGVVFLQNQIKSELMDATLPVKLKIWATQNNLTDFYTITSDSCSIFNLTDFEFLSCTEQSGTWCDATYQNTFAAPHSFSGVTSGEANATIDGPGENNTGRLQVKLNVPSYLQFDYLGIGVDSPTSTIDFGINNNQDSIIYTQDQYR
ncbi:DUF6701 domain-containing protein [Marinicellulosiphila megalodicopiae]|uniref:DUF6701 domain-containing protein n=1 Tax=Marinicellulosiphila megalodicopiae TaxID=2724896 RepID=UPI003BB15D20